MSESFKELERRGETCYCGGVDFKRVWSSPKGRVEAFKCQSCGEIQTACNSCRLIADGLHKDLCEDG